MRNALSRALAKLAASESDMLLLVGDIGYKVFDQYRANHSSQFYNFGIAEANMVGVAAGLAMMGKRPIVYTIIPFLIMRAFEQIRVDICMHKLPVMLVGVGGGLSYDILGPTHHAIEDVALMRTLPDMTVLTPSDPMEVEWIVPEAYRRIEGPLYIRLGKGGEPNLNNNIERFKWGEPLLIRRGTDVVFFSSGPIIKEVLEAADTLEARGISCAVYSVIQMKPLAVNSLLPSLTKASMIFSVEEHNVIGGLGEVLAGALAPYSLNIPLFRLGITDRITTEIGTRDYLLSLHRLSAEAIVDRVVNRLNNSRMKA